MMIRIKSASALRSCRAPFSRSFKKWIANFSSVSGSDDDGDERFRGSPLHALQLDKVDAPVGRPLQGEKAFLKSELPAISDLFHTFAATNRNDDNAPLTLDHKGMKRLLSSIGERPSDATLLEIFQAADIDDSGTIDLGEFLTAADIFLVSCRFTIALHSILFSCAFHVYRAEIQRAACWLLADLDREKEFFARG